MTAVAFGPTSCSFGLVLKSKLLHNPKAQHGFVPKHSLHGGKTSPFGLKNHISFRAAFLAKRGFSSDDVLRCEAMCGDVVACAGACSQTQSHGSSTEARRAKTSEEGFLRFLLRTEIFWEILNKIFERF